MTFGGLSVYDGVRFRNYTMQHGLLSDVVNDVIEINDDHLLVAANTCGLNVLVNGNMKTLYPANSICPIINHFLRSADGIIYASADDGLYQFKNNRLEKIPLGVTYLGELIEYGDYLVMTTNDLRNHRGLYLYYKKTGKLIDFMENIKVESLESDKNGLPWLSNDERIFNLDTASLLSGKLSLREPYSFSSNASHPGPGYISFTKQNELIISSPSTGLVMKARDNVLYPLTQADPAIAGVHDLFVDRENIIWISHNGNGVYKLSNFNFTYTTAYDLRYGIRDVRKNNEGDTLWVTGFGNEWKLFSNNSGSSFQISPASSLMPIGFSSDKIYAIDTSRLYFGKLPAKKDRTIRFEKIESLPDSSGFGGKAITDPNGNTILFERRNILVFNEKKKIAAYPFPYLDLIQGIYIDRRGKLLVISRSSGLLVFSLHPEDSLHYLKKEKQFLAEFSNASPRTTLFERSGILWVGTRYHGLMGFNYSDEQLKLLYHFRTQDGLTDNFVTSIAYDDHKNLIVGTQTGLDRIIKKGGRYRIENITKSNNVFSFIDHVWTDNNGVAYALTSAGRVMQVEPVQDVLEYPDPVLLVNEVKINGEWVSIQEPLKLSHTQRNIYVSVSAPTFIDEKQVRFSYLLEGSGKSEWSDTSSIADINLLNLGPGKYTLHIKAFFLSTGYPEQLTSISFTIKPPWWQTWWFRIALAVCLILLFSYAWRVYYRRKLERQKIVLEKQQAIEKERTRIATDMHDDLGAGLSRIKFLSETIGIKKQKQLPIEEDINSIRQYSHEMIDKMGEIVWALNEKNDSLMDLLAYTRSYTVAYLSEHGIKCIVTMPDNLPSVFVSGEFRRNIYLCVKEILHNVVKHAQAREVKFNIVVNRELELEISDNGTGFDSANTRAFSNGLNNIKKRMSDIGGRVTIQSNDGTEIRLSVPLPL